MLSCSILQEDEFVLEFYVSSDLGALAQGSMPADIAGDDGYVLQERIIVPPHLADKANGFSVLAACPLRCNAPLILIGHPDLPVQYASIIARTMNGKASIIKYDAAIRLAAAKKSLLFSEPIFSKADEEGHSFLSAFEKISDVLISCDMTESTIARTWISSEDILRDYDLLNRAREGFFKTWFSSPNHFVPASTATDCRIIGNQVLSIEFCAFSGDDLSVSHQVSPLQNEPVHYGVLFSRAVVVRFTAHKLVFISGTASIDKSGATVHAGNFERQTAVTLDVLSALLREVDGSFSDIVQAAVYLKRSMDLDLCLRILDAVEFPRAKTLFHLDVDLCRDDLLCEIEATAVVP